MKKVFAALATVALLFAGADAHAESKAAAVARASSWFKTGVERARANDFEAARTSFAAAYAIVPSTDILWNLAVAERRSGRPIEALAHFKAYLAEKNARPDRKPQAEEWIKELESETGRIVIDAPAGTEVVLDGAVVTEREVRVVAGVHGVTAKRDGRSFSVAVDVLGGGSSDVHVVFEEPAPPPPLATVTAAPPIDPLPAFLPLSSPLPVATDRKPETKRNWTSLGLGAGAVAAVGAGFVLALAASSERDDVDEYRARMNQDGFSCKRAGTLCEDYDDTRASAQRLEAASTSMFVAGGALAGAALATWLLWPLRSNGAVITPVAGSKGGGAAAIVRF